MDEKLIAWARAVKARRRGLRPALPPLWIFTDRERLPDPLAVVGRLPKGLCGVVLRPGGAVDWRMAEALVRACRARRLTLVVAGDPRVAARLGVGRHLSRGWRPGPGARAGRAVTAPAHCWGELVRARRLGAGGVFLSPVFPTVSHPGAAGLGVVRWAALARRCHGPAFALGGISGASARRLPRFCAGAGVIGAAGGLVNPVAAG